MAMSESKLNLSKIKQVPLSVNQYFNEDVTKVQIVLHHTAGNSSGAGVIRMWDTDNRGRIATCVTISGDGEICQAFSSKKWGYHLGIKPAVFKTMGVTYQRLDRLAIGIEICNWGPLTKKGDVFYNYVNRVVPTSEVCELSTAYKGHKYYHAYTDAQIESVRQLLVYWNEVHGIPLKYHEADMWTVSKRALSASPGVYTHNSYRKDKSDISPQPKMIEMLKQL